MQWIAVGLFLVSVRRLEEYRRVAAFNRRCGVDVHEISPDEVCLTNTDWDITLFELKLLFLLKWT